MRIGVVVLVFFLAQDKSPFSRDHQPEKKKDPEAAPNPPSKNKPDNTAGVVKAGLNYLAQTQRPNGSWDTRLGVNTGVLVTTAFCGMALMASGEYRAQVDKAAQFIMAHMFDKSANRDPQWNQTNWQIAVGGMFMGEYYALSKSGDAKACLDRAVAEAFQRMEPSGGWGHYHGGKCSLNYIEFEIMSNWMLVVAGMAKRNKTKLPADKLDKAVKYVASCAPQGGVGYSPGPNQMGCPGRTGGALLAYALLDLKEDPQFERMIAFWKKSVDSSNEAHGSLAMGMLGSALGARLIGPEAWDTYVTKFFPQILGQATGNGSFKHITGKTPASIGADNNCGPAYNTAIYTLILQLDLGRLKYLGR